MGATTACHGIATIPVRNDLFAIGAVPVARFLEHLAVPQDIVLEFRQIGWDRRAGVESGAIPLVVRDTLACGHPQIESAIAIAITILQEKSTECFVVE